jgi:hypothetical protein
MFLGGSLFLGGLRWVPLYLVKTAVAEGSFLPIQGAGVGARGYFTVFSM